MLAIIFLLALYIYYMSVYVCASDTVYLYNYSNMLHHVEYSFSCICVPYFSDLTAIPLQTGDIGYQVTIKDYPPKTHDLYFFVSCSPQHFMSYTSLYNAVSNVPCRMWLCWLIQSRLHKIAYLWTNIILRYLEILQNTEQLHFKSTYVHIVHLSKLHFDHLSSLHPIHAQILAEYRSVSPEPPIPTGTVGPVKVPGTVYTITRCMPEYRFMLNL